MNKRNIVVVQPPRNTESKLMMENVNLLRTINNTPLGVDTTLPLSVNKIDHSKQTSPRCVRLNNERLIDIENERARFLQRVTENGRRLSISALNKFTPFKYLAEGQWTPQANDIE